MGKTLTRLYKTRPMAFVVRSFFPYLLIAVTVLSFVATAPPSWSQEFELTEQTAITMGSWRTDDIVQMNALIKVFEKEYPDIRVIYDPTPAAEYDEVLAAQLASGTAPDIFYLRSFSVSRQLFEKGFLAPLDDLPGLQENFTPQMRAPWCSRDHINYGVPFIAVAHGIYYNQDIFQRLGLSIPRTWEELLSHAATLKTAGVTPFANASGEEWTINEIVFCNIAPNFIGGYEGRMAYLNGERCFNDNHMIRALTALSDLAPFFPENHTLLKYLDSLYLFIQGQAAMWMGGSWDIPFINAESPRFQWDVFAPPPPKGAPGYMTFHLDAGMGLNRTAQHPAAARTFLSWLTRPETGRLMADTLPGFFPMHRNKSSENRQMFCQERRPPLNDPHADTFLNLKCQLPTDIRFVWETLRDGTPDGYKVMQKAVINLINRVWSPKEAADYIQTTLSHLVRTGPQLQGELSHEIPLYPS